MAATHLSPTAAAEKLKDASAGLGKLLAGRTVLWAERDSATFPRFLAADFQIYSAFIRVRGSGP